MYPSHSSFKNLPKEIASAPKSLSQESYKKMFAPTELLAQFLSTLMKQDYENALIFCKLIQQFEPSNVTVNCFYPMILKKLQMKIDSSESEPEDDEESENEEEVIDLANDSGIDDKDNKEEGTESSSDESDSDQDNAHKSIPDAQPLDEKSFMIEAQREIIKRLRSQVVPKTSENQ